jgi:hypothetical protein
MHNFANAVKDYRYLRNRCFPDKGSLKLVGDRYELNRLQRNILFRGVVRADCAAARAAKLVSWEKIEKKPFAIDWYNVLITVESYIKGLPVFLADDGLVRDATGLHGSYRMSRITDQAFDKLMQSLCELAASRITVFLDSPIAFSGEMATRIRRRAADVGEVDVRVVPSPDYHLKAFDGVVASSDSVIVDNATQVFDLPRFTLESTFDFRAEELLSLTQTGPSG